MRPPSSTSISALGQKTDGGALPSTPLPRAGNISIMNTTQKLSRTLAPLLCLALFCCLGQLACSSEGVAIEVVHDLPAGTDAFQGVASVRVEATGPEMSPLLQESAYRSGVELTIPSIPLGPDRVITIEGLDSAGAVVAFGQSAPFTVTEEEPRQLIILFQRCSTTFFLDADRDGFGDSEQVKVVCSAQADYVDNSLDCDDTTSDMHPDQDLFFDRAAGSTLSFDYNCDGQEEQEFPDLVDCSTAGAACKDQGWVDQVPSCGQSGTFIACEKTISVCGPGPAQTQNQTCR